MNRHTPTEPERGLFGELRQATEQAEASAAGAPSAHWTPRRFRGMNALTAVAVTGLAVAICLGARAYPLWVGGLPGPGLFPMVVGSLLGTLGVAYLIGSVTGRYHVHADTEPPPDARALRRSVVSLVVLGAAAFALVPLGYPLTAAIAATTWIILAGGRRRTAVLGGILFAATSFVLVTTVLGIQLPTGVLRPVLIDLL